MSSSRISSVATTVAASVAAGVVGYYLYQKVVVPQQATTQLKDPVARVFPTKEDVARELCAYIVREAKYAIAERGVFHMAVAGGSLLDSLSQLSINHKYDIDWSKVVLSFANHKCVPPNSNKANLAKCKEKFADELGITKFVLPVSTPGEGSDGTAEAKYYAKALIQADIPHRGPYPMFDIVLLGLGADGHVGSCHPGGPAVANKANQSVVGSPKEGEPSSITLSIESMNTARHLCVVVCGGTKGKKEAVKRALTRPMRGAKGSFPAQLLDGPMFFLDQEAAADL